MENHTQKSQNRTLAPNQFNNVLLDFLLSRQAMMCTQRTIGWYKYILGKIIDLLIKHDVEDPEQISSRHMRALLGKMPERGCADSYMHSYARAMKTLKPDFSTIYNGMIALAIPTRRNISLHQNLRQPDFFSIPRLIGLERPSTSCG